VPGATKLQRCLPEPLSTATRLPSAAPTMLAAKIVFPSTLTTGDDRAITNHCRLAVYLYKQALF
jgi:hypothetical protein